MVNAETKLILGAGPAILNISVSKTNRNADFEITGYSPSTITVQCDYWDTVELPVRMDISSVQVEDPASQQLGEPILDRTNIQSGSLRLEGPRSTVSQVASIVARVEADEPIRSVQVYAARLVALDADGNEVDLNGCQLFDVSTEEPLQSETVNVTVPVLVQRRVEFTYDLLHVPPAIASKPNLVTLSVSSITLVGPQESVDSAAESLANLGAIDFDHLTPEDAVRVVSLNIPAGVTVLENVSEVTITLDIGEYTSKTLDMSLMTEQDVVFQNLSANRSISVPQQVIRNIRICGNAASVEAVTEGDLIAVVDAGANSSLGSVRYAVRIEVPSYDDVWVYYGAENQTGYEIYATVN